MERSHSPMEAFTKPRVVRMASAPPSRQARMSGAGFRMPWMGPAIPP